MKKRVSGFDFKKNQVFFQIVILLILISKKSSIDHERGIQDEFLARNKKNKKYVLKCRICITTLDIKLLGQLSNSKVLNLKLNLKKITIVLNFEIHLKS